MPDAPTYRRILLKLSGEALLGTADYGIDPLVLRRIAGEIAEVHAAGVEIGVVIGGGNIFRGAGLAAAGMDRVTGDHMGMLATVMNALALQDALELAAREVGRADGADGAVLAQHFDRFAELLDLAPQLGVLGLHRSESILNLLQLPFRLGETGFDLGCLSQAVLGFGNARVPVADLRQALLDVAQLALHALQLRSQRLLAEL